MRYPPQLYPISLPPACTKACGHLPPWWAGSCRLLRPPDHSPRETPAPWQALRTFPLLLAARASSPHLAVSSHNFCPKMCFNFIGLCKSSLSWCGGQKKKIVRDKPLAEVTDLEKGDNTAQVSKNQPTKEQKAKKREHKTPINAQLSII